jgi:2-polyprenyl-3-methyl-5-hydroxy-6-metoxy-1,4-benzoquinol methylase
LSLQEKYDRLAEGFAEQSYANLAFDMRRRLMVTIGWGIRLQADDSVIELGCGDGSLAQPLAQYGLQYRGVDLSPRMLVMAEQRLRDAGLKAEFSVTDVSQLSLISSVDAIVSFMRAFFTYVNDPLTILKRLRPHVRKKVIVDLNPRRDLPIQSAVRMLQEAGFHKVTWRPFFVPKTKKLPVTVLQALVLCERIPVLRNLPLRWKFHVLLKGETC